MPGRFVSRDERQVVHAEWWDADEQVVIRRFSYGDRQYLAGEALRVGLAANEAGDGTTAVTDLQVARMNLAILNRGIVSWTLKDERGKIPHLGRQSIEMLTEEDAEFILEQINDFNPQKRRSPEEQATFRDAGGDCDAGGNGTAAGAD